jgi:ribosomal protein L22
MTEDYKIHDGKHEEKKNVSSLEKTSETKKETVKIEKKNEKSKFDKPKKTEAVINGRDLSVGRKHAVALCDFIRGKDIEVAIKDLEDVVKMKRAVPMSGEIPHRHGEGMRSGSGRYPVKGAKIYILLLKSLKANALVNELELEKYKIFAMPNRASRPFKRFGQGRMKRSHVVIKLIPRMNKEKK